MPCAPTARDRGEIARESDDLGHAQGLLDELDEELDLAQEVVGLTGGHRRLAAFEQGTSTG